MSKLAQLRERRNAKALEAKALNDKFPADKRMPKEDVERLDAILDEIADIDSEIKRTQRLAEAEAAANGSDLEALRNAATREPSKHGENTSALRSYLTGGIAALSDAQRQALQARITPDIRAAMSTTTNSEGGFTVAPEYMRSLEEAMKAFGGMLEVSNVIRTTSGALMNFPTADATAEEGEIVGQNTGPADGETTFGNTTLAVQRYSSKKIALPWELVQDSFLDIEAYVQGLLAIRLGRITNKHWTIGDGSNKPRGIVVGSAQGKVGVTGQTQAVTYDDLVDLEHSVNRAYRAMPGCGWMMADSSVRSVRKIKDGQGRPIFVPGYETGVPGGAPDTLMGRRITVNDDVPAMAANAKSILFGAFSKYVIRQVMDLTLFRMTDSVFTLNGQVGFVAFQRMGGNLVDAGGGVKHYANSAT